MKTSLQNEARRLVSYMPGMRAIRQATEGPVVTMELELDGRPGRFGLVMSPGMSGQCYLHIWGPDSAADAYPLVSRTLRRSSLKNAICPDIALNVLQELTSKLG